MKNSLLIYSMMLLAFTACKKDDDTPPPNDTNNEVSAFEYLPNTMGSYWIYETYKIDSNGVESLTGNIDSCYVTGDTMIDNIKYTGYYNFGPHGMFKTTYLTSLNGQLRTNFGEIIYDLNTEWVGDNPYYLVMDQDTFNKTTTNSNLKASLNTPFGDFNNAIHIQKIFDIFPKHQKPDLPDRVIANMYYLKEIGPYQLEYFYFSGRSSKYRWKLERYHIAP